MQFIAGTLQQTWNNPALRDLMDLTMIPYGNAQKIGALIEEDDRATYQCQHGQFECWYNMMEGCAIKHLTQAKYMPYVFCANAAFQANAQAAAADVNQKCAPDATSLAAISTCFGNGAGSEGATIVDSMSTATASLGHQFIPWIVVGGTASASSATNLPAALCAAHVAAGGTAPSACSSSLVNEAELPEHLPSVCMKDLSAEDDGAFKRYVRSMQNKTHRASTIYDALDKWQRHGHPEEFVEADAAAQPTSLVAETAAPTGAHDPKETPSAEQLRDVQEHASRVLVRREDTAED